MQSDAVQEAFLARWRKRSSTGKRSKTPKSWSVLVPEPPAEEAAAEWGERLAGMAERLAWMVEQLLVPGTAC